MFPRENNILVYGDKQEYVSLVVSILKRNGINNVVFANMYQIEDLLHHLGHLEPV